MTFHGPRIKSHYIRLLYVITFTIGHVRYQYICVLLYKLICLIINTLNDKLVVNNKVLIIYTVAIVILFNLL